SGDSPASVMAAILKDQPALMSQRQPVPRALERVVRKCMEKKPEDRWQSAQDLKGALELIDLDAAQPTSSTASPPTTPVPVSPKRRWLWPAVVAAAIVLISGAAYEFWPKPRPGGGRVTRFQVPLPEGAQIVDINFYVRVSPDGSKLEFTTSGEK